MSASARPGRDAPRAAKQRPNRFRGALHPVCPQCNRDVTPDDDREMCKSCHTWFHHVCTEPLSRISIPPFHRLCRGLCTHWPGHNPDDDSRPLVYPNNCPSCNGAFRLTENEAVNRWYKIMRTRRWQRYARRLRNEHSSKHSYHFLPDATLSAADRTEYRYQYASYSINKTHFIDKSSHPEIIGPIEEGATPSDSLTRANPAFTCPRPNPASGLVGPLREHAAVDPMERLNDEGWEYNRSFKQKIANKWNSPGWPKRLHEDAWRDYIEWAQYEVNERFYVYAIDGRGACLQQRWGLCEVNMTMHEGRGKWKEFCLLFDDYTVDIDDLIE